MADEVCTVRSQRFSRRVALQGLVGACAVPYLSGCLSQTVYRAAVMQDAAQSAGQVLFVPETQLAQLNSPVAVLRIVADSLREPIFLRRLGSGAVVALSGICSHRGCQVNAGPQTYECPCHGSQFDLQGRVLQGPAERALTSFRIEDVTANTRGAQTRGIKIYVGNSAVPDNRSAGVQ